MSERAWLLRETGAGLEVQLHVQPRAKRTEIAGFYNGALKLRVASPPVDDAANRALVQFFSDILGIPKSRLIIASGAKSRDKILRIESITRDAFLSHLEPLLAK